jgi:hypothetical protein
MMRKAVLSIAVLIAQLGHAGANPWLKDKDAVEVISSTTITRQEAGLSGGASANGFSSFHLEYGALQNVTLVVDSGFQQYAASGQSLAAFDTAWAGVRSVLTRWDNSLLSFEVVGGVSGIRQNSLPGAPLALDGTSELRLMFGEGFTVLKRHAFAGLETGWRWRAGPPADELVFDTVLGIEPWSSGLLMLQSFTISVIGNARGAYRRYDLVKLQLSIAQRLTPSWWVQLGALGAVAGTDAGDAGGLFALWRRF